MNELLKIDPFGFVNPWSCKNLSVNGPYIFTKNADKKQHDTEEKEISDKQRCDACLKIVPEYELADKIGDPYQKAQ